MLTPATENLIFRASFARIEGGKNGKYEIGAISNGIKVEVPPPPILEVELPRVLVALTVQTHGLIEAKVVLTVGSFTVEAVADEQGFAGFVLDVWKMPRGAAKIEWWIPTANEHMQMWDVSFEFVSAV